MGDDKATKAVTNDTHLYKLFTTLGIVSSKNDKAHPQCQKHLSNNESLLNMVSLRLGVMKPLLEYNITV